MSRPLTDRRAASILASGATLAVVALAVLATLTAGAPSDATVGSVAETPGEQQLATAPNATATDGGPTALDRPAPAVDIVFVL
ncbi:hypothetical protein GJ629_02025, partial [Halapricum sp. CBA1109]|uniref:hypothetical protein n=1 Tax=Halapricum sp. CBA1109 TaxID=2668068 RepID=UPI0013BBD6C8